MWPAEYCKKLVFAQKSAQNCIDGSVQKKELVVECDEAAAEHHTAATTTSQHHTTADYCDNSQFYTEDELC